MAINLKNLCIAVNELSRETGKWFLHEIHQVNHSHIEVKGLHNFVSYVDKTAEQKIVERLRKLLPVAGFITEEETVTELGKAFTWVVDPLDGTTNFLHRIPLYSISIALMEGDKTVLGCVYEPNLDECFYSWENAPAFLNGNEIRTSDIDEMSKALLATGFPYYEYGKLEGYMNLFMHFARNTAGIRRLGSAAVDLAWTACGRFEGFYEYALHPWDVAAGAFIVKQAGGTVTDFKGGNNYIFGGEMLACNKQVHNEMLESIRQHFELK